MGSLYRVTVSDPLRVKEQGPRRRRSSSSWSHHTSAAQYGFSPDRPRPFYVLKRKPGCVTAYCEGTAHERRRLHLDTTRDYTRTIPETVYSRRGALGAASSACPARLTCGGWKDRRISWRLLAVAWGAEQPVPLRPQPAAAAEAARATAWVCVRVRVRVRIRVRIGVRVRARARVRVRARVRARVRNGVLPLHACEVLPQVILPADAVRAWARDRVGAWARDWVGVGTGYG